MDQLISIIIPVYNVDKGLLKSCIDSVLKQTYTNIEALIVDDGSVNDVASYCDEIAKIDERITVIHQKNQGVSAARNNGTKVAKGNYVLYVDSDDVLSYHALSEAHRCIIETNADLVISGVKKIKSHREFDYSSGDSSAIEMLNKDGINELKRHYIALDNSKYKNINGDGYINRGPYCRLIKKEIAVANPFPFGVPIGEDLLWNINLINKCSKICVVYDIWYGYLISSTSAIRKYYGNRIEKVEEYLIKMYKQNREFCIQNLDVYGKNVAVEFYCILRYELLSPMNTMSSKEKNRVVHNMLKSKPWKVLYNKKVKRYLSRKYKILIFLSEINMWQFAMKAYGKEL